MRRLLTILALSTLISYGTSAQDLRERYNSQRPVVIVCDWDKAPYEFLNGEGQPAGSNIDIIKAVMQEIGLPYRFEMKEWSVALKTFQRGGADIILANGRRFRKEPYVVSDNIVNYDRISVAMHSDSLSVGMVTFRNLEQEGAVFKPGDYSAYFFLDGDSSGVQNKEFQTPKVALMGLLHGDYKYYVWSEEPLKWKIRELNLQDITLNDVGIPISEVHFVGRDRELMEEIDDNYSRLKQQGDVAVIQDRWMHPERVESKTEPVYLYIIAGVLLLAAILWMFSRLARRHVLRATRASSGLNDMMLKALHMGNFDVMQYDIARDCITNHYGDILPQEGLTLEEYTQRIHPDQREEFRQKMRSLLEGRERHFQLNKRWNQGTDEAPHYLNFQGHAISELDDNGHPAYVINAIHDVTQEMEEDKAARDLIHKYEALSNVPYVAMSFYDSKGFLIDLNDSMKQLCGISDDNPESKRFWETVNMFDVTLFRGVYSKEERDDMLFCQHMYYPEFGLDQYIECHIRPLFNMEGNIANYFITTFNLTDERFRDHDLHLLARKRLALQKRIGRQQKLLRHLLESSGRFIMRSDMGSETISFFRSPEHPEYVHSFRRFLQIVDEKDRSELQHLLYDSHTATPRHFKLHLILPSEGQPGTVFDIAFNPVCDANGRITGHTGIATDITRMDQLGKDLKEQTRLAVESVKTKSAFMASMTHELRTPLNAIVGFTSVLEALGDSPDRAEYVRIIRNSSDMLQRLINDIIEASSITEGTLRIEPESIDFAKAFEDICLTLEQRVQTPGVQFLKENPYDQLLTTVDVGRIQQVLTNFVTNAVKFTKEGYIKVGYRYTDRGLYIYCEDTGAGIPKEKQKIVFDRFVKLDEFVQGTGMGLAICKSIALSMDGKIGVESGGKGQGTTFWVWIPCERRMAS